MWLFTIYGFFSIACASKADGTRDTETVMVRARVREHLERLQARFPAIAGREVLRTKDNDYRYRLIAPKAEWATIVAELAAEQTWSNFKSKVAAFQGAAGREYEHALHEVWSVMNRLQRD